MFPPLREFPIHFFPINIFFQFFLFVIYKWTCSSCPPFPVRIWNEVFSGGTKTWGPGGKPSETRSQSENLQETQTTSDANSGNRTQATAVGGEHSHHCPIPAPSNIYPGITDLFIAKPNCFFFHLRLKIPNTEASAALKFFVHLPTGHSKHWVIL